MYIPALSIVALVFGLLLVIGISTFRNIDREKNTQLDFVYRQGLLLLRAIEAGARSGMAMPMWGEDSIAVLLQETGRDETIAYIYLMDDRGSVVHHSEPHLEGSTAAWRPQISSRTEIKTRIRKSGDGSQVYELAKIFSPDTGKRRPMMARRMMSRHAHENDMIVIGLSMHNFEMARKSDVQHAIIMAIIVLALGSGTFFFIFVIQNFYLVDKTLKRTQDYTSQVIANMANGLLGLDRHGKLVSYNQVALDLLELEEVNLKHVAIENIIDFNATGIRDTIKSCRKVIDQEFLFTSRSGQMTTLSISSTPIENEMGQCKGVVVVLRDLSEIKALEQKVRESEKLAAVGRLAASVAHEVRNPLSSIKGLAQYMSNTLQDGSQQKQHAQIMVKEVDRINRVINDLLTFSRPLQPERNPTNVHELIQHAVQLIKADAETRHIELRTNLESLQVTPLLDENQMTQVLLNLLLNALSAIGQNGIIDISVHVTGDGHLLVIEVQDDGEGIAPEHMPRIFEPFMTTKEKGTGIGLAIVKKIIEIHDGHIEVTSPTNNNDRGSIFKMSIPIVSA